jgi:hypothetical protein
MRVNCFGLCPRNAKIKSRVRHSDERGLMHLLCYLDARITIAIAQRQEKVAAAKLNATGNANPMPKRPAATFAKENPAMSKKAPIYPPLSSYRARVTVEQIPRFGLGQNYARCHPACPHGNYRIIFAPLLLHLHPPESGLRTRDS